MTIKEFLNHIKLKYFVLPKTPEIMEGKIHIACIGDSITYGAGVKGKREETWEYYLNKILGDKYQVINYGISGRTLQDEGDYPYRKEKFYPISLQCKADVYLIMLGTNDAKPHNWNERRYQSELEQFVKEYIQLENHPSVILMIPPACFPNPKTGVVEFTINGDTIDRFIVDIIQRTGEKYNLQIINLHDFTKDHPEWFADGVHPNTEGNRNLARFISQQLDL